MSRLYNIPKEDVLTAWKAVKKAGGGSGYDGKKIQDIEDNLANELYKGFRAQTAEISGAIKNE